MSFVPGESAQDYIYTVVNPSVRRGDSAAATKKGLRPSQCCNSMLWCHVYLGQ
jgi:hypothetical protein